MTMNPCVPRSRSALACLALACIAATTWPSATDAADAPARPAPRKAPVNDSSAPVTLNFVNAEIDAVTRAIASMINRQMLVDPRVKGAITVYSERPVSPRDAYQSYLTALRGLGFAVVESGGLLKVVPEADAKLQTGVVSVGPVEPRADQIITQVFKLSYENPNNLVAVLRPLISPNNTINANPGTSSLVITDYADNLARMGKIIAALDQPAVTDVDVVPLKHAVATDIATLVQKLGDGSSAPPGLPGAGAVATVMPDSRSNALIVRAPSAAKLASMRALIERLDRPSTFGPAGSIHVVYLKNADATKLATVLRAAFGGGAAGSSGGSSSTSGSQNMAPVANAAAANTGGSSAATTPVSAQAQPSTGGFIQADTSTNSLVITAAEPLYLQIRSVIDQLDGRRAQVYIESMIVEVSGNDQADLGFQWLGALGSSLTAVQTLPTSGSPGILSINAGLAQSNLSLGDGLNVGLVSRVNGVPSLTAILRALQSQGIANVVSTPNLITLDNEEAKIVVGENVPFITGQYTNTGTATSNPFQTIERKDVGITLRIRPQIGENGAIRLQLYQEQSAVKDTTAAGTSNAGPSTTKRSIEGTVTVDDGQILALGGLIEDSYSTTHSKVPLLGDIPFLGSLFRSDSRTRKRTNLMVFLRPIVLRDGQTTQQLSVDRYEQIRGQQKDAQPRPSVLLPINEAPVLPPMRGTPPANPDASPLAPLPPASSPKTN